MTKKESDCLMMYFGNWQIIFTKHTHKGLLTNTIYLGRNLGQVTDEDDGLKTDNHHKHQLAVVVIISISRYEKVV